MIPVLNTNLKPLMPCSEKRARKLLESNQARPYWCKGVFCIILTREPKSEYKQPIVIGIDPGSKFEGFTVKSEAKTFLNIQTKAKTDVKDKMETRRSLRRTRRSRKTRYRKCRFNRKRTQGYIPPSTKARWDYKLSLIKWLNKIYPITDLVIEDISAKTLKGAKKWNKNFSPLEVGKSYFKLEIEKLNLVYYEYKGYETHDFRTQYGLKKNSKKSQQDFYTHCVDSWVLANQVVGGHTAVDNLRVLYLAPIKRYRRQLHRQNPQKGSKRPTYGSTRSLGFERGTLIKHPKYGLALIGGSPNNRISLNSLDLNRRLCRNAKPKDIKILTNLKWNIKT